MATEGRERAAGISSLGREPCGVWVYKCVINLRYRHDLYGCQHI